MNYARVKSYAKINLTLDVLGKENGYHKIDSAVTTVDLADVITAKKRKDGLVFVTMHGEGSESIPFESNNAAKAAERFVAEFSTCGADITVWKNIPMGAGLGGSSADVAGVLNAMAKLYGVDDFDRIKAVADGLGSDCGYMLSGGYARISGRGERVSLLDSSLKLHIGILLPRGGVSTAECYALSDRLPPERRTTQSAVNALLSGDAAALGQSLSNGLYAAAKTLNGDIGAATEALESFDPLGVNMTGSGSAVYAIFQNEQFLQYARSRYRGNCRFIFVKTVNVTGTILNSKTGW